jgi:glycosyltransferase involved in cell wall biosynthesis
VICARYLATPGSHIQLFFALVRQRAPMHTCSRVYAFNRNSVCPGAGGAVTAARITVLIPAFNEERNIAEAIACASWADEVFVVDSFSTDRTSEIATSLGARVIQHEYVNSATQKNWAIPQASCEWVMVLDADERITPQLRDEIRQFVNSPGQFHGLRIRRQNFFMGKKIRFCDWQNDSVLRVFPRDEGQYEPREVHADARVNGPVKIAGARLLHYTFDNFGQYMRKFDQYTTWAAGDRASRTRRVSAIHLAGRPAWRFFKQYILKRGFLDGRAGLIICTLSAFSVFLKYAKLWERQERESSSQAKPAADSALPRRLS